MAEQSAALTIDQVLARRRVRKVRAALIYLAVAAVVVWSVEATIIEDTEWDRIGSVSQVLETTARFLAVDWSILPSLAKPALETLMIACLGTLLGVIICIPVAWFGALNVTPFKPVTYPLARFLMTLSRSIHEIVWALIFVAGVGLGSFAGVLAIAMRSVGFIAKMSAEAIEDIDKEPVEAIRAAGGNSFQVMRYAILPQVLPVVIGVIIFEWEINIRRSAVLGLVGAGGLGLAFSAR
ncbi:MAG: phosphonate ABC transporter, permease protein PhnE [Gammaproteobacteria bacterium]|nr:phosphonate ABC transporter, permease protein PhnE [Gammaproteobacteria bacterium]